MAQQRERPLQIFEKTDPELLKLINRSGELAMSDGALSRKHKFLIAVALDAAHGTADGVKALAQQAIRAGATKEEISEALRVAYYVNGAGTAFTAEPALKELF